MTAAPGFHDAPGLTGPPEAPIATRRLYRSRTNRALAGVCGGIAEYYGADPSAVRLLAAVIALFTGIVPMLVMYLVAAIVIPDRINGEVSAGPGAPSVVVAPGRGGLIIGIALIAIGLAALANDLFRVDWNLLWPLALIVVGGALALAASRR